MTMAGGFDVHRKQITFDYVDSDGRVRWGQVRPATRTAQRGWLREHSPDGDGEFALEGCIGWRYVSEELAADGGGPRRAGGCRAVRGGTAICGYGAPPHR
jgi:transposase